MSFSRDELARAVNGGPVARVVVASVQGSVPREVGAAMLVTADETRGTIGGGALEFEAIARARDALLRRTDRLDKCPLGPSLGQCCGGSVTVLTEIWDNERLSVIDENAVVRPLPGSGGDMPLAVRRWCADLRSGDRNVVPGIIDGWMVERISNPSREIWIWGAGHVGRAIVDVLAPLPDIAIRWADTDQARFPDGVPDEVSTMIAANPADLVTLAGAKAEHYVLTYSHALDLELCHRILGRPFDFLGLIGSATKRARFRSRLAALGHSETQIARMVCPIGDPSLGKHPQAIALGVATEILRNKTGGSAMLGIRA
jgi:xanthine dehydrogenase accessory factor